MRTIPSDYVTKAMTEMERSGIEVRCSIADESHDRPENFS